MSVSASSTPNYAIKFDSIHAHPFGKPTDGRLYPSLVSNEKGYNDEGMRLMDIYHQKISAHFVPIKNFIYDGFTSGEIKIEMPGKTMDYELTSRNLTSIRNYIKNITNDFNSLSNTDEGREIFKKLVQYLDISYLNTKRHVSIFFDYGRVYNQLFTIGLIQGLASNVQCKIDNVVVKCPDVMYDPDHMAAYLLQYGKRETMSTFSEENKFFSKFKRETKGDKKFNMMFYRIGISPEARNENGDIIGKLQMCDYCYVIADIEITSSQAKASANAHSVDTQVVSSTSKKQWNQKKNQHITKVPVSAPADGST